MGDDHQDGPGVRRRAAVLCHGRRAGILEERTDGRFRFTYDERYLADRDAPAVSLTLRRRAEPFVSESLFPFFYGLLSEGTTRQLQARINRIDPDDAFGLLLATGRDTIGAVAVVEED